MRPPCSCHVLGQQAGGLAFVEILRRRASHDALEGARQLGLHEGLAGLVELAVPQEDAVRFREAAQRRAAAWQRLRQRRRTRGSLWTPVPPPGCTSVRPRLLAVLLSKRTPSRAPCRERPRRGSRRCCPGWPCRRRPGTCCARRRRGARSRKSMNVVRPSARRISMKPPPPMIARARDASRRARIPPRPRHRSRCRPISSTFSPASVAWRSRVTTMPCRARTGCAAHKR